MRSHYRQVAEFALLLAEEVLEYVAHYGTARQPERKSEAHAAGEGEEFHLLSELAVVTLLGFFEHCEVFVEHALLREGHAVDTGELLPFLIALPVCAGDGGKLDGLYVVNVLDVRSAAEIGEIAVLVEGDGAVLKVGNKLALVLVTLLGEVLERIILGHLAAFEGFL